MKSFGSLRVKYLKTMYYNIRCDILMNIKELEQFLEYIHKAQVLDIKFRRNMAYLKELFEESK